MDSNCCSFCEKPQSAVRRLIHGPNEVGICNECVDMCVEMIEEDSSAEPEDRDGAHTGEGAQESVELGGAASLSGRLVAEKKPAPPTVSIEVEDALDLGVSERAVREKGRPTTAIRVSDDAVPHVSDADLEESGGIRVRLEGEPERGEVGNETAARHVVDRLNAEGGRWERVEQAPCDAKRERGVDVTAYAADGSGLAMQVTRAERGLWEILHRDGAVEAFLTVDEATEALWSAIEAKRARADPDVVLVLNDANVGQFSFDPVIRRFRETRGRDAEAAGFAQVWLAGPTAELTVRLDVS